jgi:rod shape-determining protein MreB
MIPSNIRSDLNADLDRLERHRGRTFSELIAVAGLDPKMDLIDADLKFQDFSNQDLSGFDFTRSDVIGSNFVNAKIQDAIFDNTKADVAALRLASDWDAVDKKQFDRDLAIWFGDQRVKVYVKNVGMVMDESTLVAIKPDNPDQNIHAFGQQAESLRKTHGNSFRFYTPIVDGVITDVQLAEKMLGHIIEKALANTANPPNVIISVPTSMTEVERRAISEAVLGAGALATFVIDQPVSSGIGLGLPVEEATGSMLMEIGQSYTEVAVLSLGGQVYSRSVRTGLEEMNACVCMWLQDQHGVLIGTESANKILDTIGSAKLPLSGDGKSVHVVGRTKRLNRQKEVEISTKDVAKAVEPIVSVLAEAIELSLEAMPPELSAEIIDHGLSITGPGARLKDLDRVLSSRIRMPVAIADDVEDAGISGAAFILENWAFYEGKLKIDA